MKQAEPKHTYFFVDESGDPYFYDRNGEFILGKEGTSTILLLGFIKTDDPATIRKALQTLRVELAADKYLQAIPSFKKSMIAFHAKDDCAEVRERVFKTIVGIPFRSEFVIARKRTDIFLTRHKKSPNVFYDDIVTKLFQNQLHKASRNIIYFAVRSNRARQQPLEQAIRTAILLFEERWKTKVNAEISVYPQRPEGEPCLQVIDYMNWALQRAFVRKEMRFLNFVRDKVSLIIDLYDFDRYPKNYYNRKNTFDIKKISPL